MNATRYSGQTSVEANRTRLTGQAIPPTVGSGSPWDRIDSVRTLVPGIVLVTTPSHGGIWLSPERESEIPAYIRKIARQYAPAPWYEEDCDVTIPALWFASELEVIEPQFVAHCRTYAAADPRMRPLVEALKDHDAEHVFKSDPESPHGLYCELCGGSETDHRI